MDTNPKQPISEKTADTSRERLLLGFLEKMAEDIQWGDVTITFTVRGGKIDMIRSERVMQTFNVGQR